MINDNEPPTREECERDEVLSGPRRRAMPSQDTLDQWAAVDPWNPANQR